MHPELRNAAAGQKDHDPQVAVGDMPDLMRQNPGEFSPSSWSSSPWVTQMALSSGLPRPKAFGSRLGTR